MISKEAEHLLQIFVNKYHETGCYSFNNTDYISIPNYDNLLTELHNSCFLTYYSDSLTGKVELTDDGKKYKF